MKQTKTEVTGAGPLVETPPAPEPSGMGPVVENPAAPVLMVDASNVPTHVETRAEKRFVVLIERTIIVYAFDAAEAVSRAAEIVRSACYVQPTGEVKVLGAREAPLEAIAK